MARAPTCAAVNESSAASTCRCARLEERAALAMVRRLSRVPSKPGMTLPGFKLELVPMELDTAPPPPPPGADSVPDVIAGQNQRPANRPPAKTKTATAIKGKTFIRLLLPVNPADGQWRCVNRNGEMEF